MMDYSDTEDEKGVLIALKDQVLRPLTFTTRLLVSKPAQKTYLNTLLAAVTAFVLLIIALVAYIVFYYTYIPSAGFQVPIYLQFAPGVAPWGEADVRGRLMTYQHYDVDVLLHMPRTPGNTAAGNFMVDLQLVKPASVVDSVLEAGGNVLAKTSRPAILRYRSLAMDTVHKAVGLPLHLVGWREEAEKLRVGMMEGLELGKGWRTLPESVRVELRSEEKLQVYDVVVEFTARLKGLRYFMARFRLTSLIVLTSLFWTVEATFALVVWFSLSQILSPTPKVKPEPKQHIKQEFKDEDEMSDTPHVFPTLSGHPPLEYEGRIKQEDVEDGEDTPVEVQPPAGEQGDDEDEDADFVREALDLGARGVSDSGIGTSMESSGGGAGSVRRRRSRGLRDT